MSDKNIVQMYSLVNEVGLEGAQNFGKIKNILLKSPRELYATTAQIENSNNLLKEGQGIFLKQGNQIDEGGIKELIAEPLFMVEPVFNQTKDAAQENLSKVKEIKSSRLGPNDADTLLKGLSPNKYDTGEEREEKNTIYEEVLNNLIKSLNGFISGFDKQFLSKLIEDFAKDKQVIISEKLLNKDQTFKLRDYVQNYAKEDPFSVQLVNTAMLELPVDSISLEHVFNFEKKLQSLVKSLENEKNANKGKIILPTDCNAISSIVATDKNLKGLENPEEPNIGQTHYVEFDNDKNNQDGGWKFHWGAVIMKDGSDTVTLENAATTEEVRAPIDRTSWYFGMYGAAKTDQSFRAEYTRKNKERGEKLRNQLDS